jgi:hypothetical protein
MIKIYAYKIDHQPKNIHLFETVIHLFTNPGYPNKPSSHTNPIER